MPFSSFGLSKELQLVTAQLGYERPYPIQEQAIPAVLTKKDVFGIAPTGSGKTASYVLPLLQLLDSVTLERNRNVAALILLPTRELAIQVQEVIHKITCSYNTRLKSMAVYGGVSINPQMKGLFGVNILVATPGRLIELVEANALQLGQCKALVLDEADKLLNVGFQDELQKILSFLPQKRQNLLFSATLSEKINEIKQLVLNDPILVKVEAEEERIDAIEQRAYLVPETKKGPYLRHLIQHENMDRVLIFTSSVFKADAVVDKLKKNGISALAVHSKKSQEARKKGLEQFKQGKIKVLVATDLMARGIDIPDLAYVINYELPRSPKDYIHRIGRTGRADKTGTAISILSPDEVTHFRMILKKMKFRVMIEEVAAFATKD